MPEERLDAAMEKYDVDKSGEQNSMQQCWWALTAQWQKAEREVVVSGTAVPEQCQQCWIKACAQAPAVHSSSNRTRGTASLQLMICSPVDISAHDAQRYLPGGKARHTWS